MNCAVKQLNPLVAKLTIRNVCFSVHGHFVLMR